MKHVVDTLEKLNKPPFYFNGPKDAPSSEEIPQAAMETHQREQKGEKLQEKGTLVQRERAKRLFEARRLLESAPPPDNATNAYTPCLKENVSCYWQTLCTDPNQTGQKTWWNFEYCSDLNNGQNCPEYQSPPEDTKRPC